MPPPAPQPGARARARHAPLGIDPVAPATLRPMTPGSVRSALAGRGFLLLPVAALAVHELRYRLAYGADADSALASQGHGYLDSLAPWLVLLLGLALGAFLVRVARALAGRGDAGPRRSFAALWLLATASLVAIYAAQELLEGVFAAGHPVRARRPLRPRRLVVARRRRSCSARSSPGCFGSPPRSSPRPHASPPPAPDGRRAPALVRPRSVVLAPRGVLASAAAGRAPPAA